MVDRRKSTDFFLGDTLKPVMQKEVRQIRKGEYKYPYRLELRLNETQMASSAILGEQIRLIDVGVCAAAYRR